MNDGRGKARTEQGVVIGVRGGFSLPCFTAGGMAGDVYERIVQNWPARQVSYMELFMCWPDRLDTQRA